MAWLKHGSDSVLDHYFHPTMNYFLSQFSNRK